MMKAIPAWLMLGAAMLSTSAIAADLGYDRPAPAPRFSAYNWQGFYLGANLGYEWGRVSNAANRPEGFLGGVQVGYNWQTGQIVYGLETDVQLSGADDAVGTLKFTNTWFGTTRGRAGVSMNNVLLYGTAGVAYGGLRGEIIGGMEESKTLGGWTAGVGLEIGLTAAWTARAEYLYVDLAGRGYGITGVSNGFDASVLRFGANYRF